MAGQILGVYFKSIIGSMLASTTALLFPQYRQRMEEMRDDLWYSWDEYVEMANALQAKLSDAAVQFIGQAAIAKTLPLHMAAGFDSLKRTFSDFDAMCKDVVRDVPPEESIRTVSFTPGLMVLESETRMPPALLLGFFRGLLISFGHVLISEEVTRHGPTTRFTLKWL